MCGAFKMLLAQGCHRTSRQALGEMVMANVPHTGKTDMGVCQSVGVDADEGRGDAVGWGHQEAKRYAWDVSMFGIPTASFKDGASCHDS